MPRGTLQFALGTLSSQFIDLSLAIKQDMELNIIFIVSVL